MVGFSAGAMLTLATTTNGEDAKPAFIGNIYGPWRRRPCRPMRRRCSLRWPLTTLLRQRRLRSLGDSWKAAKRPVEFHLYEQGGHGFGMYRNDDQHRLVRGLRELAAHARQRNKHRLDSNLGDQRSRRPADGRSMSNLGAARRAELVRPSRRACGGVDGHPGSKPSHSP